MNKQITAFLIVVVVILSIHSLKNASNIEKITSIDESPYYDSSPSIWGDYIVWRRGNNQNGDGLIQLSEPSWIMVHNMKTGNTFNITPIMTFIYKDKYHHAQSPHIWGNKIIYESQISGNSTDTKLFMYNIDTNTTSEVPLLKTEWSRGRLHRIFNDWIVYTDTTKETKQAYLYNYNNGISRTLIGIRDTFSVYGIEIYEQQIAFTLINQTEIKHNTFDIWIYNVTTENFTKIITASENQIMATSVCGNIIGLTAYENDTWSVYTYDLNTNNQTLIQQNAFGIIAKYGSILYEKDSNIVIQYQNDTYNLVSLSSMYVGDLHGTNFVWMDNTDSITKYGDARDSFNIYVREIITPQEVVFNLMYVIIPVIMICIIVVYMYYDQYYRQIA